MPCPPPLPTHYSQYPLDSLCCMSKAGELVGFSSSVLRDVAGGTPGNVHQSNITTYTFEVTPFIADGNISVYITRNATGQW